MDHSQGVIVAMATTYLYNDISTKWCDGDFEELVFKNFKQSGTRTNSAASGAQSAETSRVSSLREMTEKEISPSGGNEPE